MAGGESLEYVVEVAQYLLEVFRGRLLPVLAQAFVNFRINHHKSR